MTLRPSSIPQRPLTAVMMSCLVGLTSACGMMQDSGTSAASGEADAATVAVDAATTADTTTDTASTDTAEKAAAAAAARRAAQASTTTTSTTPSTTSTTTPAAATSGQTNSVDTIVADMSRTNDATLKGVNPNYGWARGPGYNYMGNDPRWVNTPNWWKSSNPNYYTSGYWPFILPWLVMFEGDGNGSSNSRIQVRNLKLYIKSKSTGAWNLVSSANDFGGYACPQSSSYYACNGPQDMRAEADGGMSVRAIAGYNFHGWFGGRKAISGGDIAAVHVTMQARVIVNNAAQADDRSKAQYLMHVGADYYPIDGTAGTIVPAVAISRAKQLSTSWQSISMATLTDAGIQEPGGGISTSELRASPPPLD